ncbi:unnamed protein product [Trichogramma brassicae]|uniref:C2H2-type domain-containing protein n=1 Tax=Trichogramma brassicae TaxID=86971 RepID=A0A6H5HWY5_9HYME|nr:unnamed protein product [Trichogramma brassicae]
MTSNVIRTHNWPVAYAHHGQVKVQHYLRPEQIKRLLWDSINYEDKELGYDAGDVFIEITAMERYTDEPDVDENGIISPRRTTPIHQAVKNFEKPRDWIRVFRDLFKIYNRFDVNYTDETGYTHFHAACQFECHEVVQRFLEHGQDPNCIWPETGDSALHLVSSCEELNNDMMVLLLRGGANPNLANKKGWTPLHTIAELRCDGEIEIEQFFLINDELNQLVHIDARDKFGNTPLHLASKEGWANMVEMLLRRGANPNLANDEGHTPLHAICARGQFHADDLAETFFKINDELNQRVQIDPRDKLGRTPLQLAVANLGLYTVKSLLNRGADLSSFVFPSLSQLDERFKLIRYKDIRYKLGLASSLLADIECLEKKGYELDRSDALTIMKCFAKHQRTVHEGRKDHSCDICEKKFGHKWLLITHHKIVHEGQKDFACGKCQKTFGEKSRLITHQKSVHEGRKDYSCNNCEQKFGGETCCGISEAHQAPKENKKQTMTASTSVVVLNRHTTCRRHINTCYNNYVVKIMQSPEISFADDAEEVGTSLEWIKTYHAQPISDETLKHWKKTANYSDLKKFSDLIPHVKLKHKNLMSTEIVCRACKCVTRDIYTFKKHSKIHESKNSFKEIESATGLLESHMVILHSHGEDPKHVAELDQEKKVSLVRKLTILREEVNFEIAREREEYLRRHEKLKLAIQSLIEPEEIDRRPSDAEKREKIGAPASPDESALLHRICGMKSKDGGIPENFLKTFFEIHEEHHESVEVDERDDNGNAALHLALRHGHEEAAVLLLRRGADPDLANENGETLLHFISDNHSDNKGELFFGIIDELNQSVQVDARDNSGRTPMHLAVAQGLEKLVECLLRHGADPNLPTEEGSTPLHIICQRSHFYTDKLSALFFKICHEVQRPVQIDAKDKKVRTPLQLAVANIMPDVVDVLLTNGADLSSFVFPAETRFEEFIMKNKGPSIEFKLSTISRAVACVERLEEGGYELDRSDALTIMRVLAKHGLFEYSTKIEERWFDDEELAMEMKIMMITPSIQEGAQSDGEAPSYDLESLSSLATQGDSQYVHVGSSTGGSSIDGSDSGSTLTIRRGSNPENLLPTGGRFQPGDEPERREEPIDQHQQEDQVNITMDVPPTEPQSIKKDIDRGTKFILDGSFI